jgi:hypothetical protein
MKAKQNFYGIQPDAGGRLILLALSTVPVTNPSDMRVSIGLDKLSSMFGFKRYEELEKVINAAFKQILQFKQDDGNETVRMPWLSDYELDLKRNILTMHINQFLYNFVCHLRQSSGFASQLPFEYVNSQLESQSALLDA